ncbi:MAG: hypothetical protein WAW42_14635 [Candidatus Competibacteraceae bacterium]
MANPTADECMTGRELGEKLLESICQMNARLGTVVYSPIIAAGQRSRLSQAQFAAGGYRCARCLTSSPAL